MNEELAEYNRDVVMIFELSTPYDDILTAKEPRSPCPANLVEGAVEHGLKRCLEIL